MLVFTCCVVSHGRELKFGLYEDGKEIRSYRLTFPGVVVLEQELIGRFEPYSFIKRNLYTYRPNETKCDGELVVDQADFALRGDLGLVSLGPQPYAAPGFAPDDVTEFVIPSAEIKFEFLSSAT